MSLEVIKIGGKVKNLGKEKAKSAGVTLKDLTEFAILNTSMSELRMIANLRRKR